MKTHSDFLADLLTVLPSPRASIWHMLQCGKVRRPSEMRKKKHTAASPRRGLKKRGGRGITLFRHSSSTCDALRGPTALIYGCVARVWWKIYSCFAFGEAAGLRKAKLFGGTEQLRSEVSPRCQKHLLGVRWTCFSEGESDKTRSSRTKPCISRNFFFF